MTKHVAGHSRFQPAAKRYSEHVQFRSVLVEAFFFIGFLIAGGGFVLQIGGTETNQVELAAASSMLSQIVLAGFYLVAAVLFINSGRAGEIFKRTWPVLLLPALAIVSVLWSPDPYLTFRRSAAFLGTVLFGLSLASRFTMAGAVTLIIRALSLSMLLSLLLVIALPSQGVHQLTDAAAFQPEHAGLWRGIFAHKNILGGLSGLTAALLMAYGRIAFSPIVRYCALALSIVCLVGAHSGDGFAIAVFLTIMLLLLLLLERLAPHLRLVAATFLLVLFILLAGFWDEIFKVLLSALGKSSDLSGRTVFWSYLLEFLNENLPLYGYGYFAGFSLTVAPTISDLSGHQFDTFGSAHNGYLEALVAFGYIGLIIMCGVLILLAWRAIRLAIFEDRFHTGLNGLPLSIIGLLVGYNMVESVLLSPNTVWVILFSWCAANLPAGGEQISYGAR